MDSNAIWASTEDDIKSLGLTERGHIICLKGYCLQENQQNAELENQLSDSIKTSSQERVSNTKKRRL